MKLIPKLVLLFVLLLFLFSCHEKHDISTRKALGATSFRNEVPQRNPDVTPRNYQPGRDTPSQEEQEEMRRKRNLERASNIEWVKESTKNHSPVSWYLLMAYDRLPESAEVPATGNAIVTTEKAAGTFQFLRGRSRIDLLASMEKNVHEIAHAFFDQNVYKYLRENNKQMNTGDARGYVFISPSVSYYVTFPLKAMFPSGKLSTVIPKDLRTYRFDTYIDGNTSTQSDGVIGLLNELNAYYLGSQYCYDMLDSYKEAAGSSGAGLFEWVTYTQSSMSAYYEFDFFIKEYLLFMKKNHEADYEKLLSNRTFSDAYKTLHKLYADLVDSYQERIRDEMKLLNSSGEAETEIEKGWLWVKAGESHVSSGTPVFSKERETLLPVLESRRYREIEKDFSVK